MKDTSKTPTKEAPEYTDTPNLLDESVQDVADDYSRKFLVFIQQEKDRARKSAVTESSKIVAEAEAKGRLAYDKAIRDATAQADAIMARSTEAAKQLIEEADRFFKAATDFSEKTEKQIEDAKVELRRQADAVVASARERETAISEIREMLHREFAASLNATAAVKKHLEQAIQATTPKTTAPAQGNESSQTLSKTRVSQEEPAVQPPPAPQDTAKRHSDKTFVGTLNLDVYKKNPGVSKRFKEALSKVPGLEISLMDDSPKDRAKIVAYATQPVALLNILHQMSLVKSAVADDDVIKVVLQENDPWIG